jgi:hypothetical protein
MNTVQRATFAASALVITLVGAVLVTAPMIPRSLIDSVSVLVLY